MLTKNRRCPQALAGWCFIAPQMIGFIFFVLIPLITVFTYAFEEKNLLFGTSVFTGINNFKQLKNDVLFQKAFFNTLVFSAGVVPLNLILSLWVALFCAQKAAGINLIRSIIFLPVITSAVAWSIVWKYLLQGGTAGPINYFLSLAGINGPNWLMTPGWAMFSVIVTRVLKNLGMNVLIFIGAIQNMPIDVIEAAKIDGAQSFSLFWKIKLPLLIPTVLMVTIVTIIGSMRVFDSIKLLTDGGPEGSTMVMVYYIYHQAFKMFATGFASAIAVVLFFIGLLLTVLQWSLRKRISYYEA
ncbi:sugar ABC transporter permease [Treponema sp. HNW]|uniref:carbohydrate ABC transporter permease n=1 Tax=Treponema sp. HNW TaxID=3116654 RepID=UPI003D09C564